jgi:predicted transcriptional regulator
MKTISIKQPWVSLIMSGDKKYEFRTWKTNYRGPLYIHASKAYKKELVNNFDNINLQLGEIVGEVILEDIIELNEDNIDAIYNENPKVYKGVKTDYKYAWVLKEPKRITPIKVNGKLGLWEYEKIDE